MKKILVFIFFVSFNYASKAQVDIELRPNSPNLEIWIRTNGFITNDLINGITFTITWPTSCSGVDLSNSPASPFTPISMSTSSSVVNGSNNYKIFNGAGSSFNYVPTNSTFIKIMTVPVSGVAPTCPFSIASNPPVGGNWGADGVLNGSIAFVARMTGAITPASANVILPVEILSFTAEKKANKTLLQWQTVKESNLKSYILQRSVDGTSFSILGYQEPLAKNENEKVTYTFTDETPTSGINYYRIQSSDLDGDYKFSKVVSVNFNNADSDFKVSPNPAKTGAQLNILTTWAKEYDFKITDMSGRLIFQQLKLHSQNVEINGLDLANGTYIYECRTANSNSTGKLIITN